MRAGVFDLCAGSICARKAPREARKACRRNLGFSSAGDFRAGGGDLAQGALDVGGTDGGFSESRGGDPGGLGQKVECSRVAFAGLGEEIDGGGSEDLAVESGAADVPVNVGGDLLAGQGLELVGGAHPREQGSLDGEAQGAEQVVVAQEDEGERAALASAQAKEHADFLKRRSRVVLRVVEDQEQGERVDVGEMFFQGQEVGAAFEVGALPEFGEQDFQNAGGRERGLGDEHGQVAFGIETAQPGLEQGGLAGAGRTGERHDPAQGGGGVQKGQDLLVASGRERVLFIGGEGHAHQAPGAKKIFDGGFFFFSAHSCCPGCRSGC